MLKTEIVCESKRFKLYDSKKISFTTTHLEVRHKKCFNFFVVITISGYRGTREKRCVHLIMVSMYNLYLQYV